MGVEEPAASSMPLPRGKKAQVPAGSQILKLNATRSEKQVRESLSSGSLREPAEAVNSADTAAALPPNCMTFKRIRS